MPSTADLSSTPGLSDPISGQYDPTVVDVNGDLLLRVSSGENKFQDYRVCVEVLRRESRYFNALLDPTKFSEGREVETKLENLRKGFEHTASVPSSNLPMVAIATARLNLQKFDELSESAFSWFLAILHGIDTGWPGIKKLSSKSSLLALLSVYADLFDSVSAISRYVWNNCKKEVALDNPQLYRKLEEEIIRQKLYVGIILNCGQWVRAYSTLLIVWGSKKWLDDHDSSAAHGAEEAPWNYLAGGVEEELACRRHCILETISSLQLHFLHLYASKEPQCKLGYDSSPQCDSFQLGEMVRFFLRKGTLRLESAFAGGVDESTAFAGNIMELLRKLKQCPSYQIDQNHRHCGLRTRLIPRLEMINLAEQVGLCLHCWRSDRMKENWSSNPAQGQWSYVPRWAMKRASNRCSFYFDTEPAKMMYTAPSKDWTPTPY